METALQIRERLQRNEVVAMLLDRYYGKDHVEVSFFGRPTGFLRTPALLAALADAPLVPCFVYRDGDGIAVECGPIIRVSSIGDRAANVSVRCSMWRRSSRRSSVSIRTAGISSIHSGRRQTLAPQLQ